MVELIDKNELLKQINLQNGIYSMTIDEVVGLIKKEVVVDTFERLFQENEDLSSENEKCYQELYECERKIDEIKALVKNASNNFNRKKFIQSINEAIDS